MQSAGRIQNDRIAAALSCVGIIHAYDLTPTGVVPHFGLLAAKEFTLAYLAAAALLLLAHATIPRETSA